VATDRAIRLQPISTRVLVSTLPGSTGRHRRQLRVQPASTLTSERFRIALHFHMQHLSSFNGPDNESLLQTLYAITWYTEDAALLRHATPGVSEGARTNYSVSPPPKERARNVLRQSVVVALRRQPAAMVLPDLLTGSLRTTMRKAPHPACDAPNPSIRSKAWGLSGPGRPIHPVPHHPASRGWVYYR